MSFTARIPLVLLLTAAAPIAAPAQTSAPAQTGVARLQADAPRVAELVSSPLARNFVEAMRRLPEIADRTLWRTKKGEFLLPRAAQELSDESRAELTEITINEDYYYNTRYGSPLAYARAIDLLGQAGLETISGKRILDFGYGGAGHLRALASLGADVAGIDVDPTLPLLYSEPGDQGVIAGESARGTLRLIDGHWPADEKTRAAAGQSVDVFLSKNTLKNGYIHPEREVDPRLTINLGVDDGTFVRSIFEALNPGGLALIYNISPAPAPASQPYKPWSDGRCPFPRELWTKAGFEILDYDHDDTQMVRRLGKTLAWDQPPTSMDLENDLFAHYSLFRKPPR